MELFTVAIGMIALAVFAILASVSGVDSRDLSDDEHRSSYPVGIS